MVVPLEMGWRHLLFENWPVPELMDSHLPASFTADRYDGSSSERDHVPFELLDGAEVVSAVEKDGIVGYEDVELDTDSFIYRLRQLQDVA